MPGILDIANQIAAANANAELVTIPDVAHMVNMEAPDRFNDLLLDYLTRY